MTPFTLVCDRCGKTPWPDSECPQCRLLVSYGKGAVRPPRAAPVPERRPTATGLVYPCPRCGKNRWPSLECPTCAPVRGDGAQQRPVVVGDGEHLDAHRDDPTRAAPVAAGEPTYVEVHPLALNMVTPVVMGAGVAATTALATGSLAGAVAGAACLGGLGPLVAGLPALAAYVRRLRTVRRVRRAAGACAEVRPIAGEHAGVTRVHGRVHVLREAEGAPAPGCAAFRVQVAAALPCNVEGHACTRNIRHVTTRLGAGRFAISDGSGLALVDEPSLEVWFRSDAPPRPDRAHVLLVRDGDEVELVGPVTTAEVPADAAHLAPSGYREAGHALVFRATGDQPVVLLA